VNAGRPLTRAERRKYNRALYERKIRKDLIAKHGRDLGTFLYWLRVVNIRGTQNARDGDEAFMRDVVLALETVYRRHFPE
jgi:hypothetical protein